MFVTLRPPCDHYPERFSAHDDDVSWDEGRWAEIEPSMGYSRALTVGAYVTASVVLFAAAIVAAIHRVEFDDTGTNVVNGLHRYLSAPDASPLRWALVAVVGLLLAAAVCAVLAAAASTSERGSRRTRYAAMASAAVVMGLFVGLWFLAPPAFSPGDPQLVPAATPRPSDRSLRSSPLPPTTVRHIRAGSNR
jgi:hypothetical protein